VKIGIPMLLNNDGHMQMLLLEEFDALADEHRKNIDVSDEAKKKVENQ
jgi:hypothetical protein